MPPSPSKDRDAAKRRSGRNLLLPLGALLVLGGCAQSVDRMKTSAIPMEDYRNRHPIVIAEDARTLDIFPAPETRGLDYSTAARVFQFGKLYRSTGHGPIMVLIPSIYDRAAPRETIHAIRRALAAGGARAPLEISTYPVVNPNLAAPIRLSFAGIKARVADRCGQWPEDLASGGGTQGWANKPYWNFGCAYQSMIAEQVADPRDLVNPRAEDPADTEMRARAIAQIRKGTDPTTDWKTKNTNISNIGTQ